MGSRFEYRNDGLFRIGRKIKNRWHWSEYTLCSSIAYLTADGITYMGVTEYFEGVIPTETVLRLAVTRTEVKKCY